MRITLLAASVLSTSVVSAAVPIGGWYERLFGGYAYLPANINTAAFDGLRNGTSYKNGFNAGGSVGFLSNPLRYEVEYTYVQARPNGFFINEVFQHPVGGRSNANLFMFNLYYTTHDIMPCVRAFFGLGLGYAFLQTSLSSRGPGAFTFFNVSQNSFAYQGRLGLSYNFVENYSLDIAYRYVATNGRANYGNIFQANLAEVGVTYRFDCVDYV